MASALKAKKDYADVAAPDDAAKAAQAYIDFYAEQAKKHPDDATLVRGFYMAASQAVFPMIARDPTQAEQFVKATGEFFSSLESPATKSLSRSWERLANQMKARIETGKKHQALVGQDAAPLEVDAWVNGEALTDAELKGKVVLLDFWAVWCGPCIATFPHLREWHEKYSDKGLVIIGLTNYYSYGWDEAASRPNRAADLSHEDEQAAMLKFAKHHELKHVLAVMPKGAQLASKYAVSGIPQAVLIDRQGKVRMIRVGSGPDNAHALDQLIGKLVGDQAE